LVLISRPYQLILDNQPFRMQHRLQQERSNAGAINKSGLHGAIRMFAASSTSSDGVLGGFRPQGLAQRTSRIGAWLWSGSGSPKRPEPSLPASTLPSLTYTPLHSTSQLLPSFTRRVDVMTTSSSFQHLHLHIPIQNPHLYEIDTCYAGGPRSQQFLIQLFARTPTRARREVPASWGPESPSCALSYRPLLP
jgi:hypothetical protein